MEITEDIDKLTRELREVIAKAPDNVVVVVGAGLAIGSLRGSPSAANASWGGLLASGLARAVELHRVSAEERAVIEAQLASTEPAEWIQAAESITSALGGRQGGDFGAWLRATVGQFPGDVTDGRLGAAMRLLSDAGVLLATVNYDGLLEASTGLPAVSWREPVKVERILHGDERGILHLHGYWEDPQSIVFGASSYDEVSADPHARAVLTALRVQKTFVFVGHGAGLEDPNWGSFLRWTEGVFRRSEYLHYRLVRDDERADVQARHPPAQRILALPYGKAHARLAPFLAELAPAGRGEGRGRDSAPLPTVILLVNVLEKGFTPLLEESVRRAVDDDRAVVLRVDESIDREKLTLRRWRELARAIERLAREAQAVSGDVKYVVCGRAPLPVFAYLGDRMCHRPGGSPLVFLNQYGDRWDWIECPVGKPVLGPDHFTECGPPRRGSKQAKRALLSVMSWQELKCTRGMLPEPRGDDPREALSSVHYRIHAPTRSKDEHPMTQEELPVVIAHIGRALAWLNDRCPNKSGVTVALGGPAWLAFWIGYRLNPRANLGRVDYLDFDKATGAYIHALSSPRRELPWLAGRPKLLVLGAEPDELTRTGGAALVEAIEDGLAAVAGDFELRVQHFVTPEDLGEAVNAFAPDILHLHLHGSLRGVLGFEGERRDLREVSHGLFVRALRSAAIEPSVIVMSSCHTAVMAPEIEAVAECVIAMRGELDVTTAIAHAAAFYRALAAGRSIEQAVEDASVKVELRGMPSYEVIQATSAVEDELDSVVLFRGPRRASTRR